MNTKKLLAAVVEIVLGAVVIAFLGLHSVNFFMWTFPPDQYYYAWLGFGLTGGGTVAYLVLMKWGSSSHIQKTVSIIMLAVCSLGELLTAGFGMQVETWARAGFTTTQSDYQMMIYAVQALGLAHAVALIAFLVGDDIAAALRDEDGDGVPDILEAHGPIRKQSRSVTYAADTDAPELGRANPTKAPK